MLLICIFVVLVLSASICDKRVLIIASRRISWVCISDWMVDLSCDLDGLLLTRFTPGPGGASDDGSATTAETADEDDGAPSASAA